MITRKVRNLSTESRFLYWIRERRAIQLKKDAGEPKPWTDDEILQSYKFTNVLRIDDRVSQWLLKNWYEAYRDHPNMVLACSLARQLNTPAALAATGFPEEWQPLRVQSLLEQRAEKGLKNYSAAYMITSRYGRNRDPETKPFQTVWRVCNPIAESGFVPDTNSMENTWRSMLKFMGFSSFISGQVVADLRWALSGTWQDKCSWAPMGWGSVRGLNRYLGRPIKYHWDVKSIEGGFFLEEFRQLFRELAPILPKMEAIDFQGCFCEFDKYERVLHGEGRPKVRYQGV